jgi:hypothetical protein
VKVARKTEVTKLKQRLSRRLLKLPGVQGVGVQRGAGDDDYELVVHVEDDDPATIEAVKNAGGDKDIRIVKSGKFKKQ